MRHPISLGVQSDFIVSHLEAELNDHADYAVYRTPVSPDFYFGNFLALKTPLSEKTRPEWEQAFDHMFDGVAGIRHRAFIWPVVEGSEETDIRDFLAANYEFTENHVLEMPSDALITPHRLNTDVRIKPFSDDESIWSQWREIAVTERDAGHEEADYRTYLAGREKTYRALERSGYGDFFGAFEGDCLVGYAGVFALNDLARYQQVQVIPGYQNQGIARTLIHYLAQWVAVKASRQIIIADADYHASALYQSLGFSLSQREGCLCQWPGYVSPDH
ncbi:MAG: GNAT family N-acetyltransferase [Saccharospirillum sp.]